MLIDPKEVKTAKMRDPAVRDVLREEMKEDPFRGLPMNWEITMLVKSTTGLYAKFEGMLVSEIASQMSKDSLDAAFDIALDEDLTTQFRQLDTRNKDPDVMMKILNAEHVGAGFSDAGAHLITEVNTGFSTRLLGHWVRDKKQMRLEDAVRRLSSVQAEESGVTDRGKVLDGYVADLTLFDPQTVGPSERTFANDLPGGARRLVQYSKGIEYTLVNGVVTMAHGRHTGATAGRVIRSQDYAA
jgi:N-acyl-D-aspartate/D-glutamate deacylase